jgi:hypothetical protein
MSIFQGIAPPNVDTTKSTATTAPGFYTDYLSGLANAGQQALNRSPAELVAGFSPLQQQAFGNVQNAATSYQPQLQAAQATAGQSAQGITQQNIQNYLNPYAQNVVGEMARLNQQNLNQNLLPNLKAGFVGTGAGGSQRNAGALAQFLAQNQANLTGQQSGELSKGFTTALNAAGQQSQLQNQAAQVQAQLAQQQQQLGLAGNKAIMDVGAQQQALDQARINAPLTQATNAAQLMRGYTVPTSTTEKYSGPAPAYGPSPLAQISGLGSLLGSGFNTPGGWGNQLGGVLKGFFNSPSFSANALDFSKYGEGNVGFNAMQEDIYGP